MIKKSVTLKGHRTSISLEPEFWDALEKFAQADQQSLPQVIAEIDLLRMQQSPPPGLASAIRVFVVNRLR